METYKMNGMNSGEAKLLFNKPILSQVVDTSTEGAETSGEV